MSNNQVNHCPNETAPTAAVTATAAVALPVALLLQEHQPASEGAASLPRPGLINEGLYCLCQPEDETCHWQCSAGFPSQPTGSNSGVGIRVR
jgi:hypothetical protein